MLFGLVTAYVGVLGWLTLQQPHGSWAMTLLGRPYDEGSWLAERVRQEPFERSVAAVPRGASTTSSWTSARGRRRRCRGTCASEFVTKISSEEDVVVLRRPVR